MEMKETEEQNVNLCYYGKPLEPYDKDAFPKKTPILVEDQIATDSQGRRRFHGAFTGGFSAGFFNTVGSLEGWKPSTFKSSRESRAEKWVQQPQDFMDNEDVGEFGIAPKAIKATNDFFSNKNRKTRVFSERPIPGIPVLHSILSSGNDSVGYILLKNIKTKTKNTGEPYLNVLKTYGCEISKSNKIFNDNFEEKQDVPELYRDFFNNPKENTFGLGYMGLTRNTFAETKSSSRSIFSSDKKISLTGQAFGVGAFEIDDVDIYSQEDIGKYDFELGPLSQTETHKQIRSSLVLDKFFHSNATLFKKNDFLFPKISRNFTGRHKIKRSRFEPVKEIEFLSRTEVNPIIRAKYLGEETFSSSHQIPPVQINNFISKVNDLPSKQFDPSSLYLDEKFVPSSDQKKKSDLEEFVPRSSHETKPIIINPVHSKIFEVVTRITTDWYPCRNLCKKFNVPEPSFMEHIRKRKRTSNPIFEYQKYKNENEDIVQSEPFSTAKKTSKSTSSDGHITDATIPFDISKDSYFKPEGPAVQDYSNITAKLNVEKNQDLFKAVFLSSDSESDGETVSGIDQKSTEPSSQSEFQNIVMSDELLPKIRPLKQGILTNIEFYKKFITKPEEGRQKLEKLANSGEVECNKIFSGHVSPSVSKDLYGPNILESFTNVYQQKLKIFKKKQIIIVSESDEEWIEKDVEEKIKPPKKGKGYKRKKKHKKDKKKS